MRGLWFALLLYAWLGYATLAWLDYVPWLATPTAEDVLQVTFWPVTLLVHAVGWYLGQGWWMLWYLLMFLGAVAGTGLILSFFEGAVRGYREAQSQRRK